MYTDERVLREVFAQYGPVEDIQVILDHHSGVSRGFAFVYMKHLQDAKQVRIHKLVFSDVRLKICPENFIFFRKISENFH